MSQEKIMKNGGDTNQGEGGVAWLSSSDAAAFRQNDGLFRTQEVQEEKYGKAYYSDAHVAYKEKGYSLEERREKYADALRNISTTLEGNILDIGCGPGHFVAILRNEPFSREVFGIDYSASATQTLSTTEARPYIVQGSATHLPYADNSFESAYSFHTLEHLTEDQLEDAIAEISRVVTSQLYLIIPTWGEAILSKRELFNQIVDDPTHRVLATRSWWLKQFEKYGWKADEVQAESFDRLGRGWVFVLERNNSPVSP